MNVSRVSLAEPPHRCGDTVAVSTAVQKEVEQSTRSEATEGPCHDTCSRLANIAPVKQCYISKLTADHLQVYHKYTPGPAAIRHVKISLLYNCRTLKNNICDGSWLRQCRWCYRLCLHGQQRWLSAVTRRLTVLFHSYQCQLLTFVASALSSTIHRGSPSPHFAMSPQKYRTDYICGQTCVSAGQAGDFWNTLHASLDFVARRNYWKRNYASHLKSSVCALRLRGRFPFLFAV